MPSYAEKLVAEEALGREMPMPSLRFRLPAALQCRINDDANGQGVDRDRFIVGLLEDGYRFRGLREVLDGV